MRHPERAAAARPCTQQMPLPGLHLWPLERCRQGNPSANDQAGLRKGHSQADGKGILSRGDDAIAVSSNKKGGPWGA